MVVFPLSDEQAMMLQNALTTMQGAEETHGQAATDFMLLRAKLEDAMNKATPRACRIILYYEEEELAPGEMGGEPSVEMRFRTKADAAAMMMHLVGASRSHQGQPTQPRKYIFDATPGDISVTGSALG